MSTKSCLFAYDELQIIEVGILNISSTRPEGDLPVEYLRHAPDHYRKWGGGGGAGRMHAPGPQEMQVISEAGRGRELAGSTSSPHNCRNCI